MFWINLPRGARRYFPYKVEEYEKATSKRAEELLTEVQQVIEKQGIKTRIEVIGANRYPKE